MQPNGITPLVVPEDAFRAFLTHEAVGKGLQGRRQNFALPALVLGAFRFWLGFMEDAGIRIFWPNRFRVARRQDAVEPRVNPRHHPNPLVGWSRSEPNRAVRPGPSQPKRA